MTRVEREAFVTGVSTEPSAAQQLQGPDALNYMIQQGGGG